MLAAPDFATDQPFAPPPTRAIATGKPLHKQRWEQFCVLIVSGCSNAEAYAGAGFKPSYSNATRLRERSEIQIRIDELQNAKAAQVVQMGAQIATDRAGRALAQVYDRYSASADCDRAASLALEQGNSPALIAAYKLKAQLHGLLIERKDLRVRTVTEFSDDELVALIGEFTEVEALPAPDAGEEQGEPDGSA